jgi:DNA helicase HerA-like ATPase
MPDQPALPQYWVGHDDPTKGHSIVTIQCAVEAPALARDKQVLVRDEVDGHEYTLRIVSGPFHFPPRIHGDSQLATYFSTLVAPVTGGCNSAEGRPRPGSMVVDGGRRQALPSASNETGNLLFGTLTSDASVSVTIDPRSKSALPRNVGIFGTVGSGKSNSSQVLIEEASAAGWAVVVVDVEGEYTQLSKPNRKVGVDRHPLATTRPPKGVERCDVFVPATRKPNRGEKSFVVPVSGYSIELLGALLETTEAQRRMLRNCAHQLPVNFSLIDLTTAVRAYPLVDGRSAGTQEILLNRLEQLSRSGIFDDSKRRTELALLSGDLVTAGKVAVIDLSDLNDRSRNIVLGYVLQVVFDYVDRYELGSATTTGPRPPIMLVVEEIQTFFGSTDETREVVLQFMQDVARRGRKRWLSVVAISQQPASIPARFFELLNTRIIHQTKSTMNLDALRATCGDVDNTYWSRVSRLQIGHAIVSGPAISPAGVITVRPASSGRALDK